MDAHKHASTAASQTRIALMFRALGHRNYRLFAAGQLVSLTGSWMQSVAQAWLVYRLTDSAALLGLVGFASQIPVFLLASFGGAFADRFDRRRILIIAQSVAMMLAICLATLTLTGAVEVWHVFVLASLLGVVNAFDIPTRQSFLIELVGKADLFNAISLNSSMVNAARMIGPAIAGVLIVALGEGWVFFINALTYCAVLAGLLMIRIARKSREHQTQSTWASIAEGFRFAWQKRPIRGLLLLLGLIGLTGMPYAVLMPIFADRILGGGPDALGLLMSASGIGALTGALTLAARRNVYGLGRWVAIAASGFGICLILFSLSRSFWLSAVILIVTGFMMMVEMSASNTLIQTMVPDKLRGRVMAVYSMMFMGMAPLGALLGGMLAESIGAPLTVMLGGSICMLGGIVFAIALPKLRGEARQMILAQEMTAGSPAAAVAGLNTLLPATNKRRI